MYEEPRKKLPRKALTLTAMIQSVSGAAHFLHHAGVLDHESTAILNDLWRLLAEATAEEYQQHRGQLMRIVVEQIVPLSNRITKELHSIKDNPVAAYHAHHIQEAAKLLEGAKMVRKLER